jgi:hypothetical protein
MAKKYIVALSIEERKKLSSLIGFETEKARKLTHARILMKVDEGWQDREICKALDVSIPTVERRRKRYVFEGFEAVLQPRHSKRIYSHKREWCIPPQANAEFVYHMEDILDVY